MPYRKTKIYSDGSHYIAIPHTPRPKRRKAVCEDRRVNDNMILRDTEPTTETDTETTENRKSETVNLKEVFEGLYKEHSDKKKYERKNEIIAAMKPYFETEHDTKNFVNIQLERKQRNTIVRKMRLARKVNLQEFNYFCTFTYDSKKHTEETFRKKLSDCFKHLSNRKHWKYIGVWERSPEKNRLHFHGIFFIPETAMQGTLEAHTDYSLSAHKRQTTLQNTYFNARFGRSDFEPIRDRTLLGNAMAYLMKYIEKSGERLVYSKGLPTYFISDVMDEDIVCTIGQEDKKLLLFDDFKCFDEGEYIGRVSTETIRRLPKSN